MHGTLPEPKWTERDEAALQRELDWAATWRHILDRSLNATSLRSGHKGRMECRKVIAHSDAEIARMIARKREAETAQ